MIIRCDRPKGPCNLCGTWTSCVDPSARDLVIRDAHSKARTRAEVLRQEPVQVSVGLVAQALAADSARDAPGEFCW